MAFSSNSLLSLEFTFSNRGLLENQLQTCSRGNRRAEPVLPKSGRGQSGQPSHQASLKATLARAGPPVTGHPRGRAAGDLRPQLQRALQNSAAAGEERRPVFSASLPAHRLGSWGGQTRQTLRSCAPATAGPSGELSSLSEESSEEPVHRSPSCWIPFQLHSPDSLVAAAEPPSLSDHRRGSNTRGCYRHYGPRKTHSPAGLQGWAPPRSAPPTRLAPCAPSTSVYTLFLSPFLTKERQGNLPVSM